MTESVQGLHNVSKTLHLLKGKVRRDIVRRALHAAGTPVLKRMRANLDAKWGKKRGRLRKGLVKRVSIDKDRRGATVRIGPIKEAFYARFLEKGTKHIQAKPFMRPALDEGQDEAIKALEAKLWAGIKKAIR